MSLLDELLPLIQKCRRLIDTDPVKAYSKAFKLYDWAIQEPFTNDEIHNHKRFLLIEEVRALRRDRIRNPKTWPEITNKFIITFKSYQFSAKKP